MHNNRKIHFTQEQIDNILLLNKNDTTILEISKIYGVSEGTIRKIFLKTNTDINLFWRYEVNESYFDTIGHDQAYILGMFWSDGYNSIKQNNIGLGLQEQDGYLVKEIFSRFVKNPRMRTYKNNGYKNKRDGQNRVTFSIGNKNLSHKLYNLGIVDNKSFNFQEKDWMLDGSVFNSFVAGIFDGDGSISFRLRHGKDKCWDCSLIGDEKLINFLRPQIEKTLNIHTGIYIPPKYKDKKENRCVTLTVSGNNQIRIFLEWIYKDTSIKMNRKYQKYLDICEFQKNKRKNQYG